MAKRLALSVPNDVTVSPARFETDVLKPDSSTWSATTMAVTGTSKMVSASNQRYQKTCLESWTTGGKAPVALVSGVALIIQLRQHGQQHFTRQLGHFGQQHGYLQHEYTENEITVMIIVKNPMANRIAVFSI